MLAEYNPQVFDQLNRFSIAKKRLAEERKHLLEIGRVICKFNLERLIGVCLLHKHFQLLNEECLVEKTTQDGTFHINPFAKDFEQAIVPYTWKAIKAQDSQGHNWYPVEFISETSVDGLDVLPMQNQQFLNEVADRLDELGLTEVFGLSLLHRAIDERSDSIYVEVTDKAARTLTISMFPKHEIDERFTQTLWYFAPSEKEDIKVECAGFCSLQKSIEFVTVAEDIKVECAGLCKGVSN